MTTGLETAQYTCLSEQSLLIPDGIDFFIMLITLPPH